MPPTVRITDVIANVALKSDSHDWDFDSPFPFDAILNVNTSAAVVVSSMHMWGFHHGTFAFKSSRPGRTDMDAVVSTIARGSRRRTRRKRRRN